MEASHRSSFSFAFILLFILTVISRCDAASQITANVAGDVWSVPSYAQYSSNSGFFSENLSPTDNINVRSLDVTWAQMNPANGVYVTNLTGSAQGNTLETYDNQLAAIGQGAFWMRVFASAWLPQWVITSCSVTVQGTDADGQDHYPIWNTCVWGHLKNLYQQIFVTWGLAADSRLKLVYMPGGFDFVEFDWDIINSAASQHGLTKNVFDTWFDQMLTDLTTMFGSNAYKLVYTGEDYEFADIPGPFADDPFYAKRATTAGMGIRNGITEEFNFHLNEIPAYGITIGSNGHLVVDESYVIHSATNSIIATENECYNACGYTINSGADINGVSRLYYAVKMSNLKALQMRVNWLYLVPTDSYMTQYASFYNWMAYSLGKKASDSADAWVALRASQDTYWTDPSTFPTVSWTTRPYIINMERWLYQYDISPDGLTGNGTTFDNIYNGAPRTTNGMAYEGRKTQHASGQDYIYFAVDDGFTYNTAISVSIYVTYLNTGAATWHLEYSGVSGTASTPTVTNSNSGVYRTVTFTIDDALFSNSLTGSTDFRIYNGGSADVEILFVRVEKTNQPVNPPSTNSSPAHRLAPFAFV